jgi:molybdopterin-guanine dinucleotide biosynthesis protein A
MFSAAILAGGGATRFGGRDKGALIVDGRSIRAHQLGALAQVARDIMIVGGEPAAADRTAVPVRMIADRVRGCGPLGGLHAALIEARSNATVILACDMPFVSAAFLAHLLALTGEADAVVPQTDRGYHPLCAAYTRACVEPIARRLADGRLKMTGLFDDVRIRVVTTEEMRAFGDPGALVANVNTPAEYRGLEALQRHEL